MHLPNSKDNEHVWFTKCYVLCPHSKWERCPINYSCYNWIYVRIATLLSDRTTTLYLLRRSFDFVFFFHFRQSYELIKHTYTHIHIIFDEQIDFCWSDIMTMRQKIHQIGCKIDLFCWGNLNPNHFIQWHEPISPVHWIEMLDTTTDCLQISI